jgi:hypothetical protein
MSSTGDSTVTTSNFNFQLIIDALANYANQTGIDLSQNPFVEKLRQSNTPDAVLGLLQEREKSFKEYRDGNRRLINCLTPAVRGLHAFSGALAEAVSLLSIIPFDFCAKIAISSCQVPFSPTKAVFIGIDVLLTVRPFDIDFTRISCNAWSFQAASGVSSSYDALVELFELLGNFLKRLYVYTNIPPTPLMTDILVKIMVELLSVLALATKQIKQGRFSKLTINF